MLTSYKKNVTTHKEDRLNLAFARQLLVFFQDSEILNLVKKAATYRSSQLIKITMLTRKKWTGTKPEVLSKQTK